MTGVPADIDHAARAARAAFERALRVGYGHVTAQQFARLARREARAAESPNATAMRIVRPRLPAVVPPQGAST